MKNLFLLVLLFSTVTIAFSQTVYENLNANYSTFTNKNVELKGKGMLTLTASSNTLTGSTVNITSDDVWIYFPNMNPSEVINSELSNVKINGATATHGSNCRVAIYVEGAMLIPHSSSFYALTVYADNNLTGASTSLNIKRHYKDGELGSLDNNIQSFRLKKGYMATFAANANGTGSSRVFIASEGDIVVSSMPSGLSNTVSMVVVRPWNWTAKKSWRGGTTGNSGADRFNCTSRYDYNNDGSSTVNVEYVPMRHNPNWNAYSNFYAKYDCTHALGFNEPNNSVDDGYATVATAISQWPSMMESGLRLGSPACTDGGLSWLYDFIDQCDANGYRVDFVAWHFYRAFQSADQLYSTLQAVYERTGRPIWITEMNNGCNWTYEDWVPSLEDNRAKIQSWIDRLETAPFVERYVIWDGCNETLRMTNSSTGELYPAGLAYQSKVSTMAYTNDYYNNDMGSSVVAGTVQIKNRGTGLILDSNGSTANGSSVLQNAISSTSDNTKWELVPVSSSYGSIYFYIKNVGTGLFIDGYGRTTNGSDAAMYANTTTSVNAQWKFEAFNGNNYRIKNRGTGLYLDGMGRSTIGSITGQYANTVSINAQWEIISADVNTSSSLAGTYQIQNRGTGLVIDGYGRTENGSVASQYASSTTHPNSKWDLVPTGDYYQIKNVGTGLVLDGYGRTENGSAVSQYANYTTHNNSKWQLIPGVGSDGITYYYIQNVGTGLKIDGYGRTSNGSELAQYSNTTTHVNAQWKLVPTTKSALLEPSESENEKNNDIVIYPNPVSDVLNIILPDEYENAEITIFNSIGIMVMTTSNITDGINVSKLDSGIYSICIICGNKMKTFRFVKQ
ncbi:MAG: RICIN domain-containing protein [Marinilabiliaceae bacterium]|nr:RICIN domain-containing protein [Marinilabiliaceae bacterium]